MLKAMSKWPPKSNYRYVLNYQMCVCMPYIYTPLGDNKVSFQDGHLKMESNTNAHIYQINLFMRTYLFVQYTQTHLYNINWTVHIILLK